LCFLGKYIDTENNASRRREGKHEGERETGEYTQKWEGEKQQRGGRESRHKDRKIEKKPTEKQQKSPYRSLACLYNVLISTCSLLYAKTNSA